ncbi:MAG: hypothetical protein IPK27_02710 [Rhodanobacteraceae bacterium]|nr:hypothetical protein [Rhodanobacteraceae bacterium]
MQQVDGALRDALARAVGSPAPRWDEAWRDAARLYLAVDLNHAELKGLLRAAASGDAAAWRLRLPGNAGWLARAATHLDAAAWLDPPAHSFPWRGSTCTMAAERDPLQALRMGLPFDSCLAIDAGCNRHSAIINALDANKWVVYLRDPRGRILARQLIAISGDWQLIGYRVYTSIGTGEGLIDAFNDYARALAAQCGIEPADHGQPDTLNGREWYDDGTHPWRRAEAGEAAQQVEAYLGELGIGALDIPGLDLANEARRHALARAGHVAALPDWYDARPSGLRNLALLQARYGRSGLLRLLGDPQRRDRYRFEALREAPLGELLKLRRQLQDPARVGFGRDLGDNPIDDESIRHALRELLTEPADARFDDDSFEHALLTLLPRWVETLSFTALAAQLPLLAPPGNGSPMASLPIAPTACVPLKTGCCAPCAAPGGAIRIRRACCVCCRRGTLASACRAGCLRWPHASIWRHPLPCRCSRHQGPIARCDGHWKHWSRATPHCVRIPCSSPRACAIRIRTNWASTPSNGRMHRHGMRSAMRSATGRRCGQRCAATPGARAISRPAARSRRIGHARWRPPGARRCRPSWPRWTTTASSPRASSATSATPG